jgi:lactoylglutathione lyase
MKLGINSVLLFVRDIDNCTAFYRDVLKLPFVGSNPGVATFELQGRYLTLQSPEGVAKLFGIEPDAVNIEGHPRTMIASRVEDVQAAYETLKAAGVSFLQPPTDHPWGVRTAIFVDPEGNLWDINQDLEQ